MPGEQLSLPVAIVGGGGGGATNSDVITNNVIYVMQYNSSEDAERYNLTKPYGTLEAARSAADSGDIIVVYPGDYYTAINLAKNGVKWHFTNNARVFYTGEGALFQTEEITEDTVITGNGSFYSDTGAIIDHYSNTLIFEFYECECVSAYVISATCDADKLISITGAYRVRNMLEVINAACISLYNMIDVGLTATITVPHVFSSGLYAMTVVAAANNRDSIIVKCSSVTAAIYANAGNWTIDDYSGVAFVVDGNPNNTVQINGNVNTLNVTSNCIVNVNGFANGLYVNAANARVNGGAYKEVNLSDGKVSNVLIVSNETNPASLNVDGGYLQFNTTNTGGALNATISSGEVTCNGYQEDRHSMSFTMLGGKLTLRGTFVIGDGPLVTLLDESSIVDLSDSTIRVMQESDYDLTAASTAIVYNSGNLYSNGASIIVAQTDAHPIRATNPGLYFYVLSGGFNTNFVNSAVWTGNGISSRVEVNGMLSTTTLTLTNLIGSVTYTETDTETYNNTALLAERLFHLINAQETSYYAIYNPGNSYFILTTGDGDDGVTPITLQSANITIITEYIPARQYLNNITDGNILQNSSIQ